MRVWIVSVGEPLPIDGDNVRLRRMGNLADYLSNNTNNTVDWYSVSFDHYKKRQRVHKNEDIAIKPNYIIHLAYVNGYKNNISIARIIHHLIGGRKIYQRMECMNYKPDIILASMEPLEMSSAAIKYKNKYGVPIVIDVRDLWPEIYYEVINSKFHWALKPYVWYCEKILSKTMSAATAIVGLSYDFLKYGLKYAKRSQRETDNIIPISYPNYNYQKYKNDWNLLKHRFGIEKGDFVVVFLGNFGKQFDFKPIIDASNNLSKYSDIKFVLCGTGIQLEDVKKQCRESVIFPGWIEKEDIMTLTANASLGIAPYIDSMNYRLNTPNKFSEYLSASLPPIISVGGVMENLLIANSCGKKYENGIDLANIIEEYYKNEEKLKMASINARKLYEKMFNADIINERFYQYLKTIMEAKL